MTIQIPQKFQDAVEAAIEKNETVLSKVTQSQVKEITGEEFEPYQIAFYLKEYRKQHKPISKAKQFELTLSENLFLKSQIQQVLGMIQQNSPLEVIEATLKEAVNA